MELTRKISAATLTKGMKLKFLKEKKYIGRINGFVRRIDDVMSSFGITKKFVGEFTAQTLDGKSFLSNVCLLPNAYAEQIELEFEKHGSIKFAFDFFVVPTESGNTWLAQLALAPEPCETLLTNFPPMLTDKTLQKELKKDSQTDKHASKK